MADYHVKALELAREGHWEASHDLIQQHDDAFSSLIHAYLHKVEGDLSNALYWYRRAGEENPDVTIEKELDSLFARIPA